MMEKVRGQRDYKVSFLVVLIAVLLSSCIFIGTVVAWLKDTETHSTSDTIKIGYVDFDIYAANTSIASVKTNLPTVDGEEPVVRIKTATPLAITGTSAIRNNIGLQIRNTGTISAIIRVTLQIYYIDDNGNQVALIFKTSPSANNEISMDAGSSNWINDFKDGVSAGYTYYNDQVNPYNIKTITHNADGSQTISTEAVTTNAVPVLQELLLPDSMKSKTYYVSIIVDGVAYSGNIYQETRDKNDGNDNTTYQIPVEAYPFGLPSSLPTDWTAWQ